MSTPDAATAPAPARIFRKGFWAVADQGLFAGSNGIIYILLARWLSPREYGAFATAFAAFMGLSVLHTALLTEPMLIFASQRFRDHHKHYFGSLVYGHAIIGLGTSLVLAIAAAILHSRGQADLASALNWFAVAAPFILFLWLMRRCCYGQFNPRRAAMGGLGYFVLMLLLLAGAHSQGKLTIASAMTILAISSLVIGVAMGIGQLHLRLSRQIIRDATLEHLRYGRYAAATQILGYIPGYLYYFLLPGMATLEQSGAPRPQQPFQSAHPGQQRHVPFAHPRLRPNAGNTRGKTPPSPLAPRPRRRAAHLRRNCRPLRSPDRQRRLQRQIRRIFQPPLDHRPPARHRRRLRRLRFAPPRPPEIKCRPLGRRRCRHQLRHARRHHDPRLRPRRCLLEHRHHLRAPSHHPLALQPRHHEPRNGK